jgi:hypothetical protein
MTKNIFGLLLAAVMLGGCATFKAQNCSENAGYQQGVNDAKAGKLMSLQNYSIICGKADAALAEKGYKEGYLAGGDKGGAQLNVTFKGGKLGLAGAYACKAAFNGRDFGADAATEGEARAKALAKCRAEYPACGDQAVTCSKN